MASYLCKPKGPLYRSSSESVASGGSAVVLELCFPCYIVEHILMSRLL